MKNSLCTLALLLFVIAGNAQQKRESATTRPKARSIPKSARFNFSVGGGLALSKWHENAWVGPAGDNHRVPAASVAACIMPRRGGRAELGVAYDIFPRLAPSIVNGHYATIQTFSAICRVRLPLFAQRLFLGARVGHSDFGSGSHEPYGHDFWLKGPLNGKGSLFALEAGWRQMVGKRTYVSADLLGGRLDMTGVFAYPPGSTLHNGGTYSAYSPVNLNLSQQLVRLSFGFGYYL